MPHSVGLALILICLGWGMKQLGTLKDIERAVAACREACAAANTPFHADALAAALGISYETLLRYAEGRGSMAALLKSALQECTASVIDRALQADPKAHGLWMFYLRNRAGFADKGEKPELKTEAGGVTFVGEERI